MGQRDWALALVFLQGDLNSILSFLVAYFATFLPFVWIPSYGDYCVIIVLEYLPDFFNHLPQFIFYCG